MKVLCSIIIFIFLTTLFSCRQTVVVDNKKQAVDTNSIKPTVKSTFKVIETITTNLNKDNLLDTIVLSSSMQDKLSFNKISFSISGINKQDFFAKNSWSRVDSSFLRTNKNSVRSENIFLMQTIEQSVILLFSEIDGAGYRSEFSIINITKNKTEMVFDFEQDSVDMEIPVKLVDLDKDGKLDFVFTAYREQEPSPKGFKENGVFESYCPFFVYTVDTDCKLNEALTKKYNEDNYVFAGFKYNEDIEVFIPSMSGKKRACKRTKDEKLIWLTQ
jgi:hypothetical protein